MNEEIIWLLLSLRLNKEATDEELAELENLLRQYPAIAAKAAVMDNLWQAGNKNTAKDNGAMVFDKHLQRLSNQLTAAPLQFETAAADEDNEEPKIVSIHNRKKKWYWISGAAAAAAAIIFLLCCLPRINLINHKKWQRIP